MMSRRNEAAVDLCIKYQEKGYPALLSRAKASEMLRISKPSVNNHIAKGHFEVDKVTNKIIMYSIAKYLCR